MDKISELITAKAALVLDEVLRIEAGTLKKEDAQNLQELLTKSQAAIFGGRLSIPWRQYMEVFVGNDPTNIDRLVPPPAAPDPDPKREKSRAYLVRNGMCSEGTTPTILHTVENFLD